MFDQVFTDWERSAEAARDMQHEMFKHWMQPWLSAVSNVGTGAESRDFQKRWMEFAIRALNRQRDSINVTYKSGIQILEHAVHASETTPTEDYRRVAEESWHKMMESFGKQSEAQLHDFQEWTDKSLETLH